MQLNRYNIELCDALSNGALRVLRQRCFRTVVYPYVLPSSNKKWTIIKMRLKVIAALVTLTMNFNNENVTMISLKGMKPVFKNVI
jgi:hypothetical protein